MDHLRYRRQTLPTALNLWRVPQQMNRFLGLQRRRVGVLLVAILLALTLVVQESKSPATAEKTPSRKNDAAFLTQLTDSRIGLAKLMLDESRPDEALAVLISTLKQDPTSTEAREWIESILHETIWSLPTITLKHPLPVEQIAFSSPSALWVSLSGEKNTTARWNLETLEIENVLFPTHGGTTRSLVLDPTSRFIVVERKSVALLCDAKSLQPIRDLGLLPEHLTPSGVVVFSEDGLLLAHPAWVSVSDHSLIWQIRDTATGEIIRTTDPSPSGAPQPLAAFMDRNQLRVLNVDGSLLEIPISPVKPLKVSTYPKSVKLLHAQFSTDGHSALTLQDLGPHQSPTQAVISFRDGGDVDESLKAYSFTSRFSWSRQPNIWNSLMKDPAHRPFIVEDYALRILTYPHGPIPSISPITAIAFDSRTVIIGEKNGTVTVHRLLPLPEEIPSAREAIPIDDRSMKSLENLAHALAGIHADEREHAFTRSTEEERLRSFSECDFDAISTIFPRLDFSALINDFTAAATRTASPAAILPLSDRITRSKPLDTSLTCLSEVTSAFQSQESDKVLAAIHNAGTSGPLMANALAYALQSNRPEWIQACLNQAENLPPILNQIANARIAWLQGRKADALSTWSDFFPDLSDIRLRENWDGWEQADFSPALEELKSCMANELAAIAVPPNSTPEQRKAIAYHLAEPTTITTVGKRHYAAACHDVAIVLASFREELELTAKLARVARNLGAPVETSLRTEAAALTALGDYVNARARWVELITEYPIETHLAADYSEAAYTAFENADSKQAIEILNTGLRRFPENSQYALRAGWIALLTGNSERAYYFLRQGKRTGLVSDDLEHATALLVVAAAQTGATDEAASYFQELLMINREWELPETIENLDWPEALKSVVAEFTQIPVTPDPLPELDSTNL